MWSRSVLAWSDDVTWLPVVWYRNRSNFTISDLKLKPKVPSLATSTFLMLYDHSHRAIVHHNYSNAIWLVDASIILGEIHLCVGSLCKLIWKLRISYFRRHHFLANGVWDIGVGVTLRLCFAEYKVSTVTAGMFLTPFPIYSSMHERISFNHS